MFGRIGLRNQPFGSRLASTHLMGEKGSHVERTRPRADSTRILRREESIHVLAREEGGNHATIRKALATDSLPAKPRARPRLNPVFDPSKERVEKLLEENTKLPPKQRYTAHRIFEILREEGFQGSESTIRLHMNRHKQATRTPDVFLPLEYDPGYDAQTDWVRRVGAYEIPV